MKNKVYHTIRTVLKLMFMIDNSPGFGGTKF